MKDAFYHKNFCNKTVKIVFAFLLYEKIKENLRSFKHAQSE